jgi:hypothetical protein
VPCFGDVPLTPSCAWLKRSTAARGPIHQGAEAGPVASREGEQSVPLLIWSKASSGTNEKTAATVAGSDILIIPVSDTESGLNRLLGDPVTCRRSRCPGENSRVLRSKSEIPFGNAFHKLCVRFPLIGFHVGDSGRAGSARAERTYNTVSERAPTVGCDGSGAYAARREGNSMADGIASDIVCPNCDVANRVPNAKPAGRAKRGRCQKAIFTGCAISVSE